uniref:Uncharacterized protein n=1 Tax=Plectus sambesii TaxID=2011161 RepID=A0A914WQU6_9BILA
MAAARNGDGIGKENKETSGQAQPPYANNTTATSAGGRPRANEAVEGELRGRRRRGREDDEHLAARVEMRPIPTLIIPRDAGRAGPRRDTNSGRVTQFRPAIFALPPRYTASRTLETLH